MVWLMSFPDTPDCLLGPVDPREEAALTKYLWTQGATDSASGGARGGQAGGAAVRMAPTHFHVKDFSLDEKNRLREMENLKKLQAVTFFAKAAQQQQQQQVQDVESDVGVDYHFERAIMQAAHNMDVETNDNDGDTASTATTVVTEAASANIPAPIAAPAPSSNTSGRRLTWKDDSKLEVYGQRVLKGASGMICQLNEDLAFIVFYDDETRSDVFAGADRSEVMNPPTSPSPMGAAGSKSAVLMLQLVTFDAEKLSEPLEFDGIQCTYCAYNVILRGKKVSPRELAYN